MIRQRQRSDYRSGLLQGVPLACLALLIVETSLLTPYLGIFVQFPWGRNAFDLPLWTIWIIPCVLVLFIAAAEATSARIVRFPRLPISIAPGMARELDDHLRATLIGLVLALEYIAVGALAWAQTTSLSMCLTFSHQLLPTVLEVTLTFGFLSNFVLIFTGLAISTRRGRLGGRASRQHSQKHAELV